MSDDSDGLDGVDIDNGLLEDDETLDGRGVDVLDEGYTVPERPWEREHYGVTLREAHEHESLAGRLARELPGIMPSCWSSRRIRPRFLLIQTAFCAVLALRSVGEAGSISPGRTRSSPAPSGRPPRGPPRCTNGCIAGWQAGR